MTTSHGTEKTKRGPGAGSLGSWSRRGLAWHHARACTLRVHVDSLVTQGQEDAAHAKEVLSSLSGLRLS